MINHRLLCGTTALVASLMAVGPVAAANAAPGMTAAVSGGIETRGLVVALMLLGGALVLFASTATALAVAGRRSSSGHVVHSLSMVPAAGLGPQPVANQAGCAGVDEPPRAPVNPGNRAILAAMPSPVFILGDDSNLVLANPAAEVLTAKLGARGQLPNKLQPIVDQCRRSGNNFLPQDPREAILFRILDEEVFYLPCVFHFEAEAPWQSGWAVLLHNVSRIRWLDDLKTNLLASVSHEVKTPLTGIRMVLHLLLEERSSRLDERQRVLITSANSDCEKLLATLNALFELSHAESGAPHLTRMPLVLCPCLERVTRQFTPIAAARGVALRMEANPNNLPEVLADPTRLDEVLNNLVANAIHYSPPGGVVSLRLSKPDAEYLRVSVTDQGPGVPEAFHSRIFERFFRAPGQEPGGLGLGLFISREIMRAHEGRIGLLDGRAGLTEFYIDVPIA